MPTSTEANYWDTNAVRIEEALAATAVLWANQPELAGGTIAALRAQGQEDKAETLASFLQHEPMQRLALGVTVRERANDRR